jgi:hypothetical protein
MGAQGLLLASALLFLMSALVGVWVAGNQQVAWERFALFAVVTALLPRIAHAITKMDIQVRLKWLGLAGMASAFGAAWVALVFIFLPEMLISDLAAGVIIVLLPLAGVSVLWARQCPQTPFMRPALVAMLISGFGLALTMERSAWLALCTGTFVATFCHLYVSSASNSPWRHLVNTVTLSGVFLLLGAILLLITAPNSRSFIVDMAGISPYSRLYIWPDALHLIEDYRFTGSGLGQTGIVLSTYVYLFHVPFLFQVHNLFMQIAIEQGLLGLIAFAGIVAGASWKIFIAYRSDRRAVHWFCTATLAALLALLIHGLVDATLYISSLAPLLFLPIGAAIVLPYPKASHTPRASQATGYYRTTLAFASLLLVIVLLAIALLPGSRAAYYANLGAASQNRLELGIYAWPLWHIQDELRRSNTLDFSEPLAHYEHALQLDPTNTTAHRRLGQLALSRGEYAVARRHLEAAYHLAPQQRITRQLLGELYAIEGDLQHAVELWQAGYTDPHKLELREWWYTHLGAEQEANRLSEALTIFKQNLRRRS